MVGATRENVNRALRRFSDGLVFEPQVSARGRATLALRGCGAFLRLFFRYVVVGPYVWRAGEIDGDVGP
jgi:hypothetical protein